MQLTREQQPALSLFAVGMIGMGILTSRWCGSRWRRGWRGGRRWRTADPSTSRCRSAPLAPVGMTTT
jgi:hypothetical protein